MSSTTIPVSAKLRTLLVNAEQTVQAATIKRDAIIAGLLAANDIEPQAVRYTLTDEGLIIETQEPSNALVPSPE